MTSIFKLNKLEAPYTTPGVYFMLLIGNLLFFIPEIFLCFLILVLLFFNLFFKRYNFYYDIVNVNIYLTLLGILFTIYLLSYEIPANFYLLNYSFVVNNWILKVKIFILILVSFVLILSLDYFKLEKFQIFEFPIIVLL